MQTTSLPSSHPLSPRTAKDNSAPSETARAAAKFSEAMHRALTGADARSSQQKNLHPLEAEEAAAKNKSDSDSDEISDDKKRARAKRNSEHTPAATVSQFLGMAGAPLTTPHRSAAQPTGTAHDSEEAKGGTSPISDDSPKPKTIEAASTDDAETVDQSTEAAPADGTPVAEIQISAETAEHATAATAAAAQAVAAQAIEPHSAAENTAQAAALAESDPPDEAVIDTKNPLAQADASPPDARGTSAAKQDITMKKVEKTSKVAGQVEQDLPGMTPIGSEEPPKGQKLSTKDAAHGSDKLESGTIEMPVRVLTSSDSPAPTVTAAAPTSSPDLDPRVLERTHDIVALHAMRASEYTSDSLHVVVKPGAGIQLSLELRQSARGIEVHASLQKGDFDQLNQHWSDLQQRLEARGVRVAALTTSENFSSTSDQQFQQSKQQSPDQDPLYAGAFAEFALAGSMTEDRPPGPLAPPLIVAGKPGHNFMSFPISSLTSTQTSTDGSNIPVPSAQMLSQQDFLNLLVAQMTAQDPLKPTDSQDLLSQMTQFSTLNANNSMQTQLANLGLSQQFSDANSLLGKQVTLQLDSKTTAQGIVSGIDTSANVPQIIVNGQSYTLDKVISITNPTATTQ